MNIDEAAKKAIHLGKQLKAVMEVGEFLEDVVGLEQAAFEAKRHSTVAMDQLEVDREMLSKVQKQLEEAVSEYDTVRIGIASVKEAAAKERTSLQKDALFNAQLHISDAEIKTQKLVSDAEEVVGGLTKEREALRTDIFQLQETYDTLRGKMAELKERLG